MVEVKNLETVGLIVLVDAIMIFIALFLYKVTGWRIWFTTAISGLLLIPFLLAITSGLMIAGKTLDNRIITTISAVTYTVLLIFIEPYVNSKFGAKSSNSSSARRAR